LGLPKVKMQEDLKQFCYVDMWALVLTA